MARSSPSRAVRLLLLLLPPQLTGGALCRPNPTPSRAELEQCPESVKTAGAHAALFHLGSCAVQNGEMERAQLFFLRAREADPEHTPTREILARLALLAADSPVADDNDDADDNLVERVHAFDSGRLTITTVGEASDASGATAGGGVWASAPALIDWLCESDDATITPDSTLRRRDLVEGQAVLELGSGSGFVGLALAKLGAERVLLTELPQQVPLLRRSIAANTDSEALPVDALALAWGASVTLEPQWDLIVASDVTYDAELVPLLASTLSSLMRRSHNAGRDPRALLALPQRSHFQPPVIAADGAVLPDAELLFDLLRGPALGSLNVRRLATAPSEPRSTDS